MWYSMDFLKFTEMKIPEWSLVIAVDLTLREILSVPAFKGDAQSLL